MGQDMDGAVHGDSAISPRLRQYIKRHDDKLREDLGAKIDGLFAQLADRMEARVTAAVAAAQRAPAAGVADEDLQEAIRQLEEGHQGLRREMERLATSVNMRFERVLGHLGAQANKEVATAPTRARDMQGRLVDPLLTAVETRRRLLSVTQRSLAETLQADPSLCSRWLARRVMPSAQTRAQMQQWLEATEGDARAAMDRLKD